MGFDPKTFSQEPDEDLICGICLDVFEKCYVTKCNHRYCLVCLKSVLKKSHCCAFDRKDVFFYECTEDKEINRRVEKLVVDCKTCKGHYSVSTVNQHKCSIFNPILQDNSLVFGILSFMQPRDLAKICRVSKQLNRSANNQKIWKNLYLKEFKESTTSQEQLGEWKNEYKIGHLSAKLQKKAVRSNKKVEKLIKNQTPEQIAFQLAIDLSLKSNQTKQEVVDDLEYTIDDVDFEEEERYQFESEEEESPLPTYHLSIIQPIYYMSNEKMYTN